MSHITKEEYLSAFVDGEAGSFEQHRICDQLSTDEAMRDKLSSFALIGEAVRNRSQSGVGVASPSFLVGIQDAIADDEPMQIVHGNERIDSLDAVKAKQRRTFPKQALGYAVAASVVAVAAISFQNYSSTSSNSNTEQQVAAAAVTKPIEASVLPRVVMANNAPSKEASDQMLDAEIKGLMDRYVEHHLQYASSSTLMPRVRAVSYSTDF